MPQDANPGPSTGRARSRAALDFGFDRVAAFRKARRHTALVRVLRLGFPVVAVLMVAGYGLAMQRTIALNWAGKKVEISGLTISQEALVAHNPRYTGFDKQGGEFEVKAATAQQDPTLKGIVRLNTIEGKMFDASRTMTTLKSPRGNFDSNTNILQLYERIDVASQNGMTAELTQATVYTKESRIVSDEPVIVRMPSGTVRGKSMTIEQKLKQVLFAGDVVANLQPQAKQGAKPTDAGLRGTQAQTGTVAKAGDAPVNITSERLLIDDAAKVATFLGKVVAKQVDQVMETAELRVSYEGQAQGTPSLGADGGASRLRRLVSPGNVVLTRGVERATGSAMDFDAVNDKATLMGPVVISGGPDRGATSDRADIDNKSDTILLTGNVVVTQQRNVLKGRLLFADRKHGTVNLASPAVDGMAKAQISARLYQAENADKTKKPTPGAKAPGAGPLNLAQGDPSQPIDIDADTLDVDDKKKVAIFKGKVKAVQGDYVINTEEMVAHYSGEGGMALAAPAPGADAGQPKQGAQLTEVVMPRKVDIRAKDGQRAQGNSAVFNPKTNKARLTGDVVLSHGTSVTNGNCADLDMASGLMKIIDACGFSSGGTGASAGAPSGNIIIRGRAQAVFVPGMLKEEQKAKDKAAGDKSAPKSKEGWTTAPAEPAAAAPAPQPAQPKPAPRANDFQSVFGNN